MITPAREGRGLARRADMNFLGIDVRGMDLDGLWHAGRAAYVAGYLAWLSLLWRGRRSGGAAAPALLALLWWFVVTFPLQRVYGLMPVSDRIRNMWWCATAAAGNPPWESGVVGRKALEPVWSFLVSLLALRDPAHVAVVYPFLPALAIGAVAAGLAWGLRGQDGGLRAGGLAALAAFFVLLASTTPLDFVAPFRSFWARAFLLKPNHTLALAMVPVCVRACASATTPRRALGAGAALVAMGALFVVHLAVFGVGLGAYGLLRWWRDGRQALPELRRLAAVAAAAGVLVLLPNALLVAETMPESVALTPVAMPAPATAAYSSFFLATYDLGLLLPLAVIGAWRQWRGGSPRELLWLGTLLAGGASWAASAWLYARGVPLVADEAYYFLRFTTAVQAAFGAATLVEGTWLRFTRAPEAPFARWTPSRLTAALLFCCLPATVPAFWDPVAMDPHFNVSLEPMPADMVAVAGYLRAHGDGRDHVLAGEKAAVWIPALAGRRVVRISPPAPDSDAAREERALLQGGLQAHAFTPLSGVRWVVADPSLLREHALAPDDLAGHPGLKAVYRTEQVTVYERVALSPG
jgi:hypothetical protein